MFKKLLLALTLFAIPAQAWGHEGHGASGDGETLSHYLFDPLHLPLALCLGGMVAAGWILFARRPKHRPDTAKR